MSLFETQDSLKQPRQTPTKNYHDDQYQEKGFEFLCRVYGDCARD